MRIISSAPKSLSAQKQHGKPCALLLHAHTPCTAYFYNSMQTKASAAPLSYSLYHVIRWLSAFCALFCIASGTTMAQSSSASTAYFGKGQSYLGFAYGYGNLTQALFKNAGRFSDRLDYSYTKLGPMAAQFEYGLSNSWGLGLNMNYAVAKAKFTDQNVVIAGDTLNVRQTVRWGVLSFIVRANYHIRTDGPLEPYIGFGLGLRTGGVSYQTKLYRNYGRGLPLFINPFGAEATFGARYYLHPHIALFGEIGMAQAFIKGGLVIRILPNK